MIEQPTNTETEHGTLDANHNKYLIYTRLKLKLQNNKLFQIQPTKHSTFILLTKKQISKNLYEWKVSQINHHGTQLKSIKLLHQGQYHLEAILDNFVILTHYHKKDSFTQKFHIKQLNLHTNQILSLMCGNNNQNKVFIFSQTNKIVIISWKRQFERSTNNTQKIIRKQNTLIQYYQLPLQQNEDKPLHIHKQVIQQIRKYRVIKINNFYKIGWIQFNLRDQYLVNFYLYDYVKNPNKIQLYKFDDFFNPNRQLFSILIRDIWQYKTDCYYFKCQSILDPQKFHRSSVEKSRQTVEQLLTQQKTYSIFKNKQLYYIPKFAKKQGEENHQIQFINNFRSVKRIIYTNQRLSSYINALRRFGSIPKLLPLHYVDYQTEQLITIQNTDYLRVSYKCTKYIFPFFEPNIYMGYYFQIGDYIKIELKRFKEKNLYIPHIIDSFIKDVDFDLIFYVCQLVQCLDPDYFELKWNQRN